MAITLGALATALEAELRGDAELELHGVASLWRAGPGQLSFLAGSGAPGFPDDCKAAALVLSPEAARRYPGHCLVHPNPYLLFARAAARIEPRPVHSAGIDGGALVAEGAHIGDGASIGPGVIVEAGARIGAGVRLDARSHVAAGARIGAHSHLAPGVVVYRRCTLGERCHLAAGVVIGAPGFGWVPDPGDGAWVGFPQRAAVRIGDDVDVGANSTIDRGALDDTVIGDGVKIDNLVHIGHNVVVGEHTVIVAFVCIGGSARIGKRCQIGGSVTIQGHITITDDVRICGATTVLKSINEPGVYSCAIGAQPRNTWNRNQARLQRLDELAKKVRSLECGGGNKDGGP